MKKISLEDKLYEQAKRYAEEEGFPSVTAFLRHLIASYPFVRELKKLCEQGLIAHTIETHKQSEASREGYSRRCIPESDEAQG